MPNLSFSDPVVKAVLLKVLKIGAKTFIPGGGVIVAGAEALWDGYQTAVLDEFKVPEEERAELLAWLTTEDDE